MFSYEASFFEKKKNIGRTLDAHALDTWLHCNEAAMKHK